MSKTCREFDNYDIRHNSQRVVKNHRQSVWTRDILYFAVLLAITLVIGLYIIATTVLITQDGVGYINLSKKLSGSTIKVIKHGSPFGYPFLIFLTHKTASFFCRAESLYSWIYSAQCVSLLCRALSLIPLYMIGKILVRRRKSFWGLLILIMLPYPGEFGSDVVREWPHILFLSTGLLFLIMGTKTGKWWMFAAAGLAAGLGHMIRAECAQIVLYGGLWLLIGFLYPRPHISRPKAVFLTLVLLVGFAVPSIPYWKIRGKILPSKLKSVVSCSGRGQTGGPLQSRFYGTVPAYTASYAPTGILKALARLGQELSDNLMYFFALPLVIGLYCRFRKIRRILFDERLFILALVILYVVMMVLLHINYGYISRRHCMPVVVFTVFYIPASLRIMARWLSEKTAKDKSALHKDRGRWFFILLMIGLGICAGKFTRIVPLRGDKKGYLEAAEWLSENTGSSDVVAANEPRIAFYANRPNVKISGKTIPAKSSYIVILSEKNRADGNRGFDSKLQKRYSTWVNKRGKKGKIAIYKITK